ncbi:MAG: DUF1194 domain-containing protein [Pseudomonadota bacterium]
MRAAALALGLLAAAPAEATCRLALALALDVSSSVDKTERQLQLEGLARALEDRSVREAIFSIPGTTIALMVFEWSGQSDQDVISPWVEVATPADLDSLSADIRRTTKRKPNRPTALGAALEFARVELSRVSCFEQKIDVSGDGRNNDGIPPERLYEWRNFGMITVNALSIGSETKGLSRYFEDLVIRGPGAFVVEADDYSDYARAIREKLIREIGVPRLGMAR